MRARLVAMGSSLLLTRSSYPATITKGDAQELLSRLRKLTKLAERIDVVRDLRILLRDIWDNIVSHIVDFLETAHPPQSRIWWCPTAEFSPLPLHVANPFRTGASGLYNSSYIRTMTALIRARRPSVPDPAASKEHFVATDQANASCVSAELINVGQLVDAYATFQTHRRHGRTLQERLDAPRLPRFPKPKGAVRVRDGRFMIPTHHPERVAEPRVCVTSLRVRRPLETRRSPDERIDLTSAMQFPGFRSVIGTMWAVAKGDTDKITSVFHQHMVGASGCLDHTRAAFALHKTMRTVKIPPD